MKDPYLKGTKMPEFIELNEADDSGQEVSLLKDVAIGLAIAGMAFAATGAFAFWMKHHADPQAKKAGQEQDTPSEK